MTTVADLQMALEGLSPRDQQFALDLINNSMKRELSPKQMYWVDVLVKKATASVVIPQTIRVGDIVALLKNTGLKYPKVRLTTSDGKIVVLKIAGSKSKYAGSIMVTDGGPYGANAYYGRISPEGDFYLGKDHLPEVVDLLKMFALDPAGVGAQLGRVSGSCCFCGRSLDSAKSLQMGYGPACAKNYKLPWG